MSKNLKSMLELRQPCIGAWLTVASPVVAEAMASIGFHWLAVDMEHNPLTLGDACAAFLAAERYDVVPIVRLPSDDPIFACQMLDAGARGLLVPAVEDPAAFEEFTQHCFYPPEGKRGVSLSRFNRWGDRFDEDLKNFRPLIIPMIETKLGMENVYQIAALPQTDAIFVGPYDLSMNLGVAGDFDAPIFIEALEKIKIAAEKNNTSLGIHQVRPDISELKKRLDEGYSFIAYSTDLIAMRHALDGIRNTIG